MTTIVYRDGVLAGDTGAVAGGWIVGNNVRKVFKTTDGRLIGFCGRAEQCQKVLDWLILPERERIGLRPGFAHDSGQIIEIHSKRDIRMYDDDYWHRVYAPFHAMGSGMPAALGAMHMGATAVQAVRIAMKLDDSTNGRVMAVRL